MVLKTGPCFSPDEFFKDCTVKFIIAERKICAAFMAKVDGGPFDCALRQAQGPLRDPRRSAGLLSMVEVSCGCFAE